MPSRLVLVDDHRLVREALTRLIETCDEFEVVGVASDGRDGLKLCRELRPDVAIMDVELPGGLGGLEATRSLRQELPETRVLVLSMHSDPLYAEHAREAGAHGYMAKDAGADPFLDAVRAVATGEAVFPAPPDATGSLSRRRGRSRLTPRETEVLTLVAEGESNLKIAARLGISVRTVEAHRREINSKLNARSVASLVLYAIRHQLVQA